MERKRFGKTTTSLYCRRSGRYSVQKNDAVPRSEATPTSTGFTNSFSRPSQTHRSLTALPLHLHIRQFPPSPDSLDLLVLRRHLPQIQFVPLDVDPAFHFQTKSECRGCGADRLLDLGCRDAFLLHHRFVGRSVDAEELVDDVHVEQAQLSPADDEQDQDHRGSVRQRHFAGMDDAVKPVRVLQCEVARLAQVVDGVHCRCLVLATPPTANPPAYRDSATQPDRKSTRLNSSHRCIS